MTIRKWLQRRYWAMVASGVAVGLWVSYWGKSRFGTEHAALSVAMLGLGLVCVLVALLIVRRTVCPRCAQRLDRYLNQICLGSSRDGAITACPHCGVSFGEPCDGGG